jgi:hypothetical protein
MHNGSDILEGHENVIVEEASPIFKEIHVQIADMVIKTYK